jgi:hypothetical protein
MLTWRLWCHSKSLPVVIIQSVLPKYNHLEWARLTNNTVVLFGISKKPIEWPLLSFSDFYVSLYDNKTDYFKGWVVGSG